jgi:hypothetical protein
MKFIRMIQAFQKNGKEFRFPEDFHLFLDKNINVYVAVELSPDCFEMASVDSKILENTIIGNNQNHFNVGYVQDDPGRYDPWEWAVIKAKAGDVWIEKSDVGLLFDAEGSSKTSKPGSRSDNQTIQILSAAIQMLSEELISQNSRSKLIKEVKGSHSLNIETLAKEIEDHGHRWWTNDADGKAPMGMGSRNIKDKISSALKLTNKAE